MPVKVSSPSSFLGHLFQYLSCAEINFKWQVLLTISVLITNEWHFISIGCIITVKDRSLSYNTNKFMECTGNIISLMMHSLFFSCQASLETPWFTAGEGCNMSFFYHMSGNSMGTLSVEIKTVDKMWFMVFRKAGDQGNTWYQGTVDLSVRIIFSCWQIAFIKPT